MSKLADLHAELAEHAARIAKLFKNPRVSIVVRNPDLPDGDVLISDDAPIDLIAAIERLQTKPEQRLGHFSSSPSILCPQCGTRSYNPHDIEQRYCGNCHQFHADMEREAKWTA